jgi:hypothetical protein
MLFLIFFWITIEAFLTAGLIFIVLCLSKFNRKERHGDNLLYPMKLKLWVSFVLLWILFYILIFEFDIQLFFKYRDQAAMKFYLFWKILGATIIYERKNSKKWLLDRLKIHTLHSHNIEWENETKALQ